jgi:NitT/TauT family transport system permease protein
MRGLRGRLRILAGIGIVAAVGVALAFPQTALNAVQLPLFALFSTTRMVVAYLLSLVFAITYGATAATNKRAAVIMLPVLDVLQSVPILGFFPAALVFFVATFQGSPIGIELAVMFLIFTSMAWNMAFGVYESLTTIPVDLESAAASFGLRGMLRFRLLALPAAIPKLVYNSILSWSNGWFFLVASETFTAFGGTYTRPGLGSFIANAGIAGDTAGIGLGVGVLAAVVLALDTFVWRPLGVWSERFRMETTGHEVPRVPSPYERFRWLPRFPRLRRTFWTTVQPVVTKYHQASVRLDRTISAHRRVIRDIRYLDLAMFIVILLLVVVAGVLGLARLFLSPLPPAAAELPRAAASSFIRLGLAYGFALAWTIPLAAWIGRSPHGSRYLTPVLEVAASLPATALLPIIVGFALIVTASLGPAAELSAILIALFSMQWYLLFNLIAGVRAIPEDLNEAARSFGLRGRAYWRRVLLPAMVPSLLTGSITAWGAGWNALIVSEYIPFLRPPPHVSGLGYLLDIATFTQPPDNEMILLTILTMIVIVLAMNKLLWRPLYKRAAVKYRLEV